MKTVQQIPKILTILSNHGYDGNGADVLKKVVTGIGMQEVIDEEKRDDDGDSDSSDD